MKILTTIALLQSLLFASYTGTIVDKETLKPISKVTISDSKHSVKSDENGSFNIRSDENRYYVKAYGYRPYNFAEDSNQTIIEVEPITIKALYLTFWGANLYSKTFKKLLHIIDKSEVNALVIDIKNEYGSTSYKTSFDQANNYGSYKQRTNRDMKNFMKVLKEKNIYTIARIVTFKDELQAINNKEMLLKSKMERFGETMTIWHGLTLLIKEAIIMLYL